MKRVLALALGAGLVASAGCTSADGPPPVVDLPALTEQSASNFARITLACVRK